MCERSGLERAREWGIRQWARGAGRLRDQAGNGSTLTAALVVLYGIATLGQQNSVPLHFWEKGHIGDVLLVVFGLLAGLGSFVVTFSVKGLLTRAETDGELTTPCRDIAWIVEVNTKIPRGAVGVHVWEIAGPPLAQRLRRRTTFRTTAGGGTPVLWTRGKGVLGQCWADRAARDELTDLDKLRIRVPDEASFCKLPRSERFNMTWQEFQSGERYDLIWVTKLFTGRDEAPKLWGMLSVDVKDPGHATEFEGVLAAHATQIRALLDLCETLVSR